MAEAECTNLKIAKEFLMSNEWPTELNDSGYDRCYCESCYPSNYQDTFIVGGNTCVVPRGFTRFGVKIDESYAIHLNIRESWADCFHGTSIKCAKSMAAHQMFLLPGEETKEGKVTRIPGEGLFLTTPTIKYAIMSAYTRRYNFYSKTDGRYYEITVGLQCKQKPDSFVAQRETVGAGAQRICSFIQNEVIEWQTKERASIIPYGLLLRVKLLG